MSPNNSVGARANQARPPQQNGPTAHSLQQNLKWGAYALGGLIGLVVLIKVLSIF